MKTTPKTRAPHPKRIPLEPKTLVAAPDEELLARWRAQWDAEAQSKGNPLPDLFGQWPGDESDEEIREAFGR